jgi:hypothetical protein
MATYRSDKTQLTFGPEAAQGGYPEPIFAYSDSDGIVTARTTSDGAVEAGSKKITVDSASGLAVGDFILIGGHATGTEANQQQQEIRRIDFIDGLDLYLDRPLGMYHPDQVEVDEISALPVDYASNKGVFPVVTFLPGVYDTVTLPEPANTIEPSYFLGTDANRNMTHAYRGQQSYDGSLSSVVLVNGWPIRFPFGKMLTVQSTEAYPGVGAGDTTIASGKAAKKGDVVVEVTDETDIAAGSFVYIGDNATQASATNAEIRQVIEVDATNNLLYLNYGLQFDHAAGDSVKELDHTWDTSLYTHTISETTDLDTISWSVLFKDSADTDGNALIRRYYGGMVSSATISAEEGGLVQMSWDSVPFMGMVHNIKNGWDAQGDSQGANLPGYHLTSDPGTNTSLDYVGVPMADATDGGYVTAADSDENAGFPDTEPYYFSQGEITMHGATIARVRDFSLSVDNGVEPRYYIEKRGDTRRRGPSELHEQRRSYSLSATLVPDSIDVDGTLSADTANAIFSEYLLQGDYGALGTNQGIKGFGITLEFARSANDYIKITVSESTKQSEPNAVLTAAPLQIDGNNPLQLSAEILLKSLSIEIKDYQPFYP